jgi:hypothetical protein
VERFKLLASAIAGKPVEVAPVASGLPPWTDGSTVYLDEDGTTAVQVCCVAVQASLLGAGSLDTDAVAKLAGRPKLCRRYLAVEGHRALAAVDALLPGNVRRLIDHSVAARSASPAESFALASSPEEIPDPPDVFGAIRPRQVRTTAAPTTTAGVVEHRPGHPQRALPELEEAGLDERAPFDLLSSPVGGGGSIGRLLARMLEAVRRSSGGGTPGADPPTRRSQSGRKGGRAAALSSVRASRLETAGLVARRGTRYPEWDVYRRRYRHDWCTVIEVPPAADARSAFAPPPVPGLRRPLARLGVDFERQHRQTQGDDIDLDAAVEANVGMMAGTAPEEAVYIDSLRRARDLAVLFLLDVSGSAGEPAQNGGAVHEHQRAAAAALTMTLHDLGDRVALYGFRSHGRTAVQVIPLKRFGEGFGAPVLWRLGELVPGAYTRLGAAIRHGGNVLATEGGTAWRLVVVLSDGFAYDHGYEGVYGEADARRALAELRHQGIGCLCLSVSAGTDADALARVFGTAAHASIPSVQQLTAVIGPLFRSALQSAELQRHAAQRRTRTNERLQIEGKTA